MIERTATMLQRSLQCPTPEVLDLAELRDAQFVKASLVSSGITRGEPLSVPGSASIASGLVRQVTAIGYLGYKSPSTTRQRNV
jgi:hypothetical protein